MSMLKELISLGFTPFTAVCIIAIIAIWARFEYANRKQNATREEWHASTIARVDEMAGHVEECNEDRNHLKGEIAEAKVAVARLEERTTRYAQCPKHGCPNRLP